MILSYCFPSEETESVKPKHKIIKQCLEELYIPLLTCNIMLLITWTITIT